MYTSITSHNINKRKNSLRFNNLSPVNIRLLSECVINQKPNISILERVLKNWTKFDTDYNIAFSKSIDVLREFCKKATVSDSNKAFNIFKEYVLFCMPNSKNAKTILENVSKNETGFFGNNCRELLEDSKNIIILDRIIKNENSLLKRNINLNNLFRESNLYFEDNIENSIFEACNIISNLPVSFGTKYTVAMENIKYCLDSISHCNYSNKDILENITEYFLYSSKSDKDLQTIQSILTETKLYSNYEKYRFMDIKPLCESDDEEEKSEADKKKDEKANKQAEEMLDKFKKQANKEPTTLKQIISTIYTKSPNMIIDQIPSIFSVIRNCIILSTLAISPFLSIIIFIVDKFISMGLKRDKTEKLLKKFKEEKKKAKKKFDDAKNESQKKKLDEYIKKLDQAIKKITEYRDSLYSEKENDERGFDDDDMDSSDLGDDIDFGDDLDFNFESCINLDQSANNDTITYIDLNQYFDIYHDMLCSNLYITKNSINSLLESFKDCLKRSGYNGEINIINDDNIEDLKINKNIDEFIVNGRIHIPVLDIDPTDIQDQSKADDVYNMIDAIIETIESNTNKHFVCLENSGCIILSLSDIKIGTSEKAIDRMNECIIYKPDLIKMASIVQLSDNISDILNSYKNKDQNTCTIFNFIKNTKDYSNLIDINTICNKSIGIDKDKLHDNINCLKCDNIKDKSILNIALNQPCDNIELETVNDLYYQSIIESSLEEIIHELSIANSLKMAGIKLKNKINSLSDKEKIISKRVDDAIENFKRKVEISLTNKNRESVIKSTILPSASTCLKIILGATVIGYLVNPYVSVVGVLGALAISKAGNIKERQMILDEINIQIELIDKKKQLAENNNDMKALEALMQMENKLKRERQRIKYKLKDYSNIDINQK